MELSPLRRVWVLLGVLVLAPGTSAAQQLSCPRVPDVAGMSHDVHSDIETRVGSLGKITGADLKVKTDVVAQNIYEKSPNLDRIAVTQMMLAVYCSSLEGDNRHESQLRLAEFSQQVFRFVNPDYHSFPSHSAAPPRSPATPSAQSHAIANLLNDIKLFNENKPVDPGAYGWGQYVGDADTLYRRAMGFYDLLGHSSPKYADVSSIYAALDEASDELSMRGKLMHDSGMVNNDNYDRHIFVGPGWFRSKAPVSTVWTCC